MCLVAFIASDHELPLIARAPDAPMHVERANDLDEHRLRRHSLTQRHLYSVGAQGCACDFQVEADADDARSLVSLADYLERAAHAGPIDFFACWIGDEAKPPTSRATVTAEYFRRRPFEFEDRKLLTIAAG